MTHHAAPLHVTPCHIAAPLLAEPRQTTSTMTSHRVSTMSSKATQESIGAASQRAIAGRHCGKRAFTQADGGHSCRTRAGPHRVRSVRSVRNVGRCRMVSVGIGWCQGSVERCQAQAVSWMSVDRGSARGPMTIRQRSAYHGVPPETVL